MSAPGVASEECWHGLEGQQRRSRGSPMYFELSRKHARRRLQKSGLKPVAAAGQNGFSSDFVSRKLLQRRRHVLDRGRTVFRAPMCVTGDVVRRSFAYPDRPPRPSSPRRKVRQESGAGLAANHEFQRGKKTAHAARPRMGCPLRGGKSNQTSRRGRQTATDENAGRPARRERMPLTAALRLLPSAGAAAERPTTNSRSCAFQAHFVSRIGFAAPMEHRMRLCRSHPVHRVSHRTRFIKRRIFATGYCPMLASSLKDHTDPASNRV